MIQIPTEVINQLGAVQAQIWQTVGLTVSEAISQAISFGAPLSITAKTSEVYSEISAPMMVIQFAFASEAENSQLVLVPQDTVLGLYELIENSQAPEVDEVVIASVRASMEAIVQGICLAVGMVKNEAIVASGLSIRFQMVSFPPNIQQSEQLGRTQVSLSAGEFSGSLVWLMPPETVHFVLGLKFEEQEPDAVPFQQVATATLAGAPVPRATGGLEDFQGLEILMDVPLEISVELGRVKMRVKEILDLGTGSIVEIDKAAGEPVDVMVNGRTVARGEVVVIEDNFGVRITEILNPNERLGRIGEAA